MNYRDENLLDEELCSKKSSTLGEEFNTLTPQNKDSTISEVIVKPDSNLLFKFSDDAFQTPIIGLHKCGVKLRQVNNRRNFPDVMLIQFQGTDYFTKKIVLI